MIEPRGPLWGTPAQAVQSETAQLVGGSVDAFYAAQKSKRLTADLASPDAPPAERTPAQEDVWQRMQAWLLTAP